MSTLLIKKTGMSLVEVVIGSAIVLLMSAVLVSANVAYFKTSRSNLKTIKATYLIEEGIEAVNFIKNSDWNNLGNVNTNYYLIWTGDSWSATTTINYIDQIYERKFATENVNRDSNDDIVLSGGTIDPNTRKLTVQVSWVDTSGTITKSIYSYLTKPNE